MRQVILDTETTGLYADQGDRIIEIGCIEMVNRRLSGRTLHYYINPERKSHAEAVKVHGLTDEFLADKPVFARIADQVLAFIGGAELIIHNAAFDIGFLDAEFKRLGLPRVHAQVAGVIDTLLMAREQYPGKANSLDALCRRLEVDNTNRTLHGALLDAGLLAEVYIRMTRGQDALVIDATDHAERRMNDDRLIAVDLSTFDLPVLCADDDALLQHAALLADLDKASGGKTVWRRLVA
jgi:DNA polymerase-3 subunit epsilon